jgi:hypothetical protein
MVMVAFYGWIKTEWSKSSSLSFSLCFVTLEAEKSNFYKDLQRVIDYPINRNEIQK